MASHSKLHASCPLPDDADEPSKGSCKRSQPGHSLEAIPASLDLEGGQPSPKRRKLEAGSTCERPEGEDVEYHQMPALQLDEEPPNVDKSEPGLKERECQQQEIAPQTQPGLPGLAAEGAGFVGGSGLKHHRLEERGLAGKEQGGAKGCDERMMHVLAVDDSPVDRKLVERLLKDVPYRGERSEGSSVL